MELRRLATTSLSFIGLAFYIFLLTYTIWDYATDSQIASVEPDNVTYPVQHIMQIPSPWQVFTCQAPTLIVPLHLHLCPLCAPVGENAVKFVPSIVDVICYLVTNCYLKLFVPILAHGCEKAPTLPSWWVCHFLPFNASSSGLGKLFTPCTCLVIFLS